nr:hypothetical protein Iba_chr10aCG11640 [Ipomoea batatas]
MRRRVRVFPATFCDGDCTGRLAVKKVVDLSGESVRGCLVFQRSRMALAAAVAVAGEGFQRCGVGRDRRFMVEAMKGMVQAV